MTSGYGNDMARTHTQPSRSNEQKGMRHYDEHLARTTRERQERGINMPVHFSSGYERADRPIGRHPVDSVKHLDPKDGGVWEPVQRQVSLESQLSVFPPPPLPLRVCRVSCLVSGVLCVVMCAAFATHHTSASLRCGL